MSLHTKVDAQNEKKRKINACVFTLMTNEGVLEHKTMYTVLMLQGSSSPVWLYVLICAICVVVLGLMVLIGFLYSTRR